MGYQVISDTIQEFNGERFYLCGKYFQHNGKRLHRAVWEYHNGEIPEGYHIHHIDGNRFNNDITNLSLMPGLDHMKEHAGEESRRDMRVKSIEYAGKADVYNMEVEDTHDFVVNGGTVVHNCYDEMRYVCMARPIAPRANVKKDDVDWRNMDDPLNMLKDKYSKR